MTRQTKQIIVNGSITFLPYFMNNCYLLRANIFHFNLLYLQITCFYDYIATKILFIFTYTFCICICTCIYTIYFIFIYYLMSFQDNRKLNARLFLDRSNLCEQCQILWCTEWISGDDGYNVQAPYFQSSEITLVVCWRWLVRIQQYLIVRVDSKICSYCLFRTFSLYPKRISCIADKHFLT